MKNEWLDKWTKIKISQVGYDFDNEFFGKWYASRQIKKQVKEYEDNLPMDDCSLGQIASENYPATYFLHKDGTWVKSTCKDGEWSGYWDSKEELEKCLRGGVSATPPF